MYCTKNWPESLFVALVMFGPLIAALFLRGNFTFFIVLIAGMGIGLAAWLVVVFLSCWLFDRNPIEINRKPDDASDESSS